MTDNNTEIKMTDINTKKSILMGIISIIMGAWGIVLHYVIFFLALVPILDAETEAAQACAATAPTFLSIFADIGFLGGLLWILAGIAFLQNKKWGYPAAVIGVVLSLKSSFWPNIPAMESGAVPPYWFAIFIPNLVMYFVLLRSMRNESWIKMLFGMLTGMAFILSFINGIASTTRMVTIFPIDIGKAEMFMLTQRLNMIASILFGIATIGLFLAKKKEWVRIVGLSGAILSMVGGFPLAIYSMFFFEASFSFSPFIGAPLIGTLAGIAFLIPPIWRKIMGIEKPTKV